jgi:hypothetical protein
MGFELKAPWTWCPLTYTDPKTGQTCERTAIARHLNLLVYIEYTCFYQCPGPPPAITSFERKRVLGIFDFD